MRTILLMIRAMLEVSSLENLRGCGWLPEKISSASHVAWMMLEMVLSSSWMANLPSKSLEPDPGLLLTRSSGHRRGQTAKFKQKFGAGGVENTLILNAADWTSARASWKVLMINKIAASSSLTGLSLKVGGRTAESDTESRMAKGNPWASLESPSARGGSGKAKELATRPVKKSARVLAFMTSKFLTWQQLQVLGGTVVKYSSQRVPSATGNGVKRAS